MSLSQRTRTLLTVLVTCAFLLPSGCASVFIAENAKLVQGTVFWVFVVGALGGAAVAGGITWRCLGSDHTPGHTRPFSPVLGWTLLAVALWASGYILWVF